MYKILSIVFLLCTSSAFAFDSELESMLNVNLSVKNIVRSKLWYEGVNPASIKSAMLDDSKNELPEELEIAIEKALQ